MLIFSSNIYLDALIVITYILNYNMVLFLKYTMVETDQIRLREFTKDDFKFYYEIYSDKRIMTFVKSDITDTIIKNRFGYVINSMKKGEMILYIIESKILNLSIGVIGIKWNQASKKSVEIGIILKREFHGSGYAHNAKMLLMEHAIKNLGINHIIAICFSNNIAANKANEKLGFTKTKEFYEDNDPILKTLWEISLNKINFNNIINI